MTNTLLLTDDLLIFVVASDMTPEELKTFRTLIRRIRKTGKMVLLPDTEFVDARLFAEASVDDHGEPTNVVDIHRYLPNYDSGMDVS